MEEGALMDYTAAADYITSRTGHTSMHFAGYSMGTTQLLMLLTMRPEYNDRFRSAHLMGPVAQAGNASNPMVAFSDAAEAVQASLDMIGVREFLPNMGAAQKAAAASICPVAPELCRAFFATFLVMNPEELGADPTVVSNFLTHMPSGSSIGQMVHYAQLFRNGGKFTRWVFAFSTVAVIIHCCCCC